MPQGSSSVDEIFFTALNLASDEERAAYLLTMCGDKTPLRAKVEALLATYPQAKEFLETPPVPFRAAEVRQVIEHPGSQIGPYTLLEQIGEGGMGNVFIAEQKSPVQRQVALKIIKPGMDSRRVIARFEAERQALSLMDHPHIAKVLDAGTTESGRPYFVMELVKGVPITRYCDDKQLTLRQRLELLLPVLQAIQHAHQKGIIHRDIKPSNVLVAEFDEQPTPKVIDFGVAKAVSEPLSDMTIFTGFGQIVGTLEYMSPEQAKVNQFDIDPRCDIYSLGILLYELLTGTPPFEKRKLRESAWHEALRTIREVEPPLPSTRLTQSESLSVIASRRQMEPAKLIKSVRGELDWIVMKAIHKDREGRYESAQDFADDIRRYLTDQPVKACPPSTTYLLKKFARQHRSTLNAVAIFVVALLTGTGIRFRTGLSSTPEINSDLPQKINVRPSSLDSLIAYHPNVTPSHEFEVVNTYDSGPGSLRSAIDAANKHHGRDTITFNLSTVFDSDHDGYWTISPLSPLPNIIDEIVIDATTQPGYTGRPLIEIEGSQAGKCYGLHIAAGNSTVRGLVINRFSMSGINLILGGNIIQRNYIGTDVTGTIALGNAHSGLSAEEGAGANIIGTNGDGVDDDREGNLISGNQQDGISLDVRSNENIIAGNLIGTDITGTRRLPNRDGIRSNGDRNRVGTNADGVSDDLERNIISGNNEIGITLGGYGFGSMNVVAGNYIGVDISGERPLGNDGLGIAIQLGADHTIVGGRTPTERNIISANGSSGIHIANGPVDNGGTHANRIIGNYIGTDVTGTKALGNGDAGVKILLEAHSNFIGIDGDGIGDDKEGNLISGNRSGVVIYQKEENNVVAGNLIGMDVTGTDILPNKLGPFFIENPNNRIGSNHDGISDEIEENIIPETTASGHSRRPKKTQKPTE